MVFGFSLFKSSRSTGSSGAGSASSSPSSSPSSSAPHGFPAAGALTTSDATPSAAAVCPPLTAVPASVVAQYPALALSTYNLTLPERCANVLALAHNAARLEMADMCADILPVVVVRGGNLNEEEMTELKQWWAGFARFIVTTSLVTDMVTKKAFGDVYVGFRKETRGVAKLFERQHERNNVTLELAVKKMATAMDKLDIAVGGHGMPRGDVDSAVARLEAAWGVLYGILTDIYSMAEDLVAQIDRFGTDPVEYKGLEMSVAKIYTQRKRWGEKDEAKRGELVVLLTRWMADEAFMRNWMATYLTKQDLKKANGWMNDYRAGRLVIVDRFHSKKLTSGAGAAPAFATGVPPAPPAIGGAV